jgi:hypothetical protein
MSLVGCIRWHRVKRPCNGVSLGQLQSQNTDERAFNLIIRQLARGLQLDKPLAFALASRIWQAATGPITIALIIWSLTEDEQGIYYGIIPVIGIQAFFELGLLNVLISQAGHAHAAYLSAIQSGDRDSLKIAAMRMKQLIVGSRHWFAGSCVLFAAAALAIGWNTFVRSDASVAWRLPLLVVVPLSAVAVYFSPSLAILEGTGRRELIYRFRLYQMICGSLAVWLALAGGFGIWALVVATGIQACWATYLVSFHQADFFRQVADQSRGPEESPPKATDTDAGQHFSWARDVLPKQWRVAVMGAAFHLATQFLTIIVLTFHTAAEGGRLGMTLSITTAIQMLALAWVQTKYSLISGLHGQGDREEAGTLWRQTAVVSCALLVTAFTLLTVVLAILPWFGQGWETRFIRPWQVAVLGAGCLANQLVALQGCYVLARNANPLTAATLVGYLTTAVAVWIGGYYASTSGVVVAFAVGIAVVALPLHSWAYVRFRSTT